MLELKCLRTICEVMWVHCVRNGSVRKRCGTKQSLIAKAEECAEMVWTHGQDEPNLDSRRYTSEVEGKIKMDWWSG